MNNILVVLYTYCTVLLNYIHGHILTQHICCDMHNLNEKRVKSGVFRELALSKYFSCSKQARKQKINRNSKQENIVQGTRINLLRRIGEQGNE